MRALSYQFIAIVQKQRDRHREREREREREIVCKSDLMRVRGGESVVGSLGDLDPLQA
jgi:hypothetical protein